MWRSLLCQLSLLWELPWISAAQAIPYAECMENCSKHRDIHDLARLLCYTLCFFFAEKNSLIFYRSKSFYGDCNLLHDFLLSIQGMGLVLLSRVFITSLLVCFGIHIFNLLCNVNWFVGIVFGHGYLFPVFENNCKSHRYAQIDCS